MLHLETRLVIDAKTFEQVFGALRNALPAGLPQAVETQLRTALTSALARLDLVTREEFDVQTQVLARTRARLEELERLVAGLEKQIPKK